MITKLSIRNFKKFEDVTIDLGQPVVFIGPNNSGKTTALQALALWETGYRKWIEKRGIDSDKTPKERSGISINRVDLTDIPVRETKSLWKDKHIFAKNEIIFIDIIVEGVDQKSAWKCGFEFYFANDESLWCRPLRLGNEKNPARMPVPEINFNSKIAFLPPMSGLADKEFLKQPGEIDFLLGQGQTAQVLRNLCYLVFINFPLEWEKVVQHIKTLFGVEILPPEYTERAEIIIKYKEKDGGVILELPASGRGLQQTLLLLVYLYSNPNSILLLDEPDAHLEILRQRQIFNLITQIASEQNAQIVAASHSEVVLTEAISLGTVVAFLGNPHTVTDRPSQIMKSLTTIGFDQYLQAEQKGWVLYLESASDLAILKAFSEVLGHQAEKCLSVPFVHYVSTNLPQRARDHFFGLKEAKQDLIGISIFDRLEQVLNGENQGLIENTWRKREIENYFCLPQVFLRFASESEDDPGSLFAENEKHRRVQAMQDSISEIENALKKLNKTPWSDDIKASDEFMENLFREYSNRLGVPLVLRKNEYHKLVRFLYKGDVDEEIITKLNLIYEVSQHAKPRI
jgi:ABC-type nitrate/sulfonate/bicarbonate transport system ATPase subunit